MSNYELFQRILRRSKEFSFDGSVLTLRDYNTGDTVKIDLSEINEDTFEDIEYCDEDEEEEW